MSFNNTTPNESVIYYGQSDLLAQIADELRNNPTSCFSLNVLAWYNEAYASTTDFNDCKYQVNVSKQKCIDLYGDPDANKITLGSALDFLVQTAISAGRRDGRRLILNFCRLARASLIKRLASRV